MKVALSPPAAGIDAAASRHDSARRGLPGGVALLARLESISAGRGLAGLAGRLADLAAFVGGDLETFEAEFARLERPPRLVGESAGHLLELGGKRLRPTCVALASRLGSGFDHRVLDLAVAVELVHSATLLHDDVVDLSDTRRGAASARAVYGNAASIFAGDWLLVEALRRVARCRLPGMLEELLDTIETMICAESLQLEARGRLADRELYFQIVEGKTASLFRWAMRAGGFAAGLAPAELEALADYGRHLGVAFQAIDDLLDLTGDVERTGKELFSDLREGKTTYPLIVAVERDPALGTEIESLLASGDGQTTPEFGKRQARRVIQTLAETGAVDECLRLARESSLAAVAALEPLPRGRARRALGTVAEALVDRDL